jgi:hypothetical protein
MPPICRVPFISLIVLAATACTSSSVQSNFPDLDRAVQGMPVTQSYTDPAADLTRYTTFTVASAQATLGQESGFPNPVAEQQILFVLRNILETVGYRYVDRGSDADLVFTLVGSHEFRSQYVPPSTRNQLVFVPGQTYNSVVDWSGSGGSGNGSVTTTTPGRFEWQQKAVPGYNVGYYYPEFQASAFEARTGRMVWTSSVTAVSNSPDIRLPAQLMLAKSVIDGYPPNTGAARQKVGRTGIGAVLLPTSNDGNTYWPAVTLFTDPSLGQRAGLRKGDAIIAINGESTRNRAYGDVLQMLDGPSGSNSLTVRRGTRELTIEVPR